MRINDSKKSHVGREVTSKFWIIWSPTGRTPPSVQHPTIKEANTEAQRLARLNPGSKFYVLTAETLVVKRDVDIIRLEGKADRICEHCEIPF